jgi:hypothetical protein
LLFIKAMNLSILDNNEYHDRRCENCIGANPDSSPKAYAIRSFIVGGLFFVGGICVFGKGYLGAGKSRYAGFWFVSVG